MNKVTNERLKKIASWREQYGNGHNVVIPSDEAEAMASELLALREAGKEPVAVVDLSDYIVFGEERKKAVRELYEGAFVVGQYLYAAPQLPAVPDGWVMVPKVPTMAMMDEFDSIIDYGAEDSKDAWSRLIAAAPKPEVK